MKQELTFPRNQVFLFKASRKMANEFPFDVYLSHSSKDKAVLPRGRQKRAVGTWKVSAAA
jgi:hypothetical protein